ncbi:MAG: TerB family tellurite resistance protein [Pseudomonadota bacterium]
MSIWGKVLGGVGGFAIGGPLGAIIGAVAGHAVDKIRDSQSHHEHDGDATRSIAFTVGVVVLGAKMAKADGTVTPDEVRAFKQVFRVPPDEVKNVARVFDQARKDSTGFEPYARQIAVMFENRHSVLEELLHCLTFIARADGTLSEDEKAYLKSVSDIFGLDDAAFERVTAISHDTERADPYQVLGVPRDSSDDQVKSAYHKLVRDNHPDRLVAEGMPEEFIEVANHKLAAINVAYETVAAERGLR